MVFLLKQVPGRRRYSRFYFRNMEKDTNASAEINVKHTPLTMEIVVVRLPIYVFNKLQCFSRNFLAEVMF